MKNRIKRRAIWYRKWQEENHIPSYRVAKDFIKGMNRKFFTRNSEDKTCWMEWYGHNISTDKTLQNIDAYMQQYIRYIISGKNKGYKKNAMIEYVLLKKLGYKSLVNDYWKRRREDETRNTK